MPLHHGTTVEISGTGIFIRGGSGAGKSDLAIRLMEKGAKLVADDYTELTAKKDQLIATAPEKIKGLVEAYGIGLISVDCTQKTQIKLVVQLAEGNEMERMPEAQTTLIEGISLPVVFLCAKHASATAKLALYLKSLE